MSTLPSTYQGRPVPADYLAFAASLTHPRIYCYSHGGITIDDLSFDTPGTLAKQEPYRGDLPKYAFLQEQELYKPLEHDDTSPDISEADIRSGFIIGSANGGDLFINLRDNSIWVIYSDLFCQRIAADFAELAAHMKLEFDFADYADE